ncbi:MAG: copper amine oxidase N-terminal domain-containing protein [Clostridiales bacterium]|nr:copper amine oxidase N-terminal domain-containing protein [Clostridiales bacterium]
MKKLFIVVVSVVALALIAAPAVFAAEDDALPYYGEFSGTVQSIEPWVNADGSESDDIIVLLENKEGAKASFIVSEITYMLTENELKVGAHVSGYYLNNMPLALIYPPRYHAMLLAVDVPDGQFIKVARFNDLLISDDNSLKLNIGENTEIVLFGGEAAPADLKLGGLRLAVFYGVSTRSIPAITTPDHIIVLALADAVPLPGNVTAEVQFARDGMPLVVDGKLLENAPAVYVLADGTAMIPLRAVAEALGYEVGWHDGRTVSLDGHTVLTIGKAEYTAGDKSAVKLETAPELHDSRTYVPLAFFKQVLKLNNAYALEGQIEINDNEVMQ